MFPYETGNSQYTCSLLHMKYSATAMYVVQYVSLSIFAWPQKINRFKEGN